MNPVLSADSIGRSFGSRRVLDSATLWARAGEITVLMGRNGTGKTTLLRIAAGRLKADWGAVRYCGQVSERPRHHEMARRGLFCVPQEGLLPRGRSVRQVARAVIRAFPPEERTASETGGRREDDDVVVDTWAAEWELDHLLDAPDEELSGGERNRASMALAVLRRPLCLLTDEPLTGSAPKDRGRITRMLEHLRDEGCAIVVTGHETWELLEMADRVLWMVAGTTRDLGTPEEAARSHQFRRGYLGPGFRDSEPV